MLIKDISRSLQLQTAHKLQAGRLAVRTHWFDRQIHAALTHAPSAAADGAGNQRQVVLLGAGMDTRPWRDLEYPSGADPMVRMHLRLKRRLTCHLQCFSCSAT